MVCDSVVLGWTGGAAGIAVQVPSTFALGDEAPSSKPRMDGSDIPLVKTELTSKQLREIEKVKKKAANADKKAQRKGIMVNMQTTYST